MRVHGFYLDEASWIETFKSNVKLLAQTIDELDKLFIPIVGLASEPKFDLKALEAAWSELSSGGDDATLRAQADQVAAAYDEALQRSRGAADAAGRRSPSRVG